MTEITEEERDQAREWRLAALYQAGEEKIKEAIRLHPDNAELYVALSDIYDGDRRWEEAIEARQQALRLEPHEPDHFVNLGVALCELGRMEEAIAVYRAGLRVAPDHTWLHYLLGHLSVETGRAAGAMTAYHDLLRLAPDDLWIDDFDDDLWGWAAACCYLCLMMKQMGLLDDAVARLQEAVRRDPERAAAFLARRQPEKGSNE